MARRLLREAETPAKGQLKICQATIYLDGEEIMQDVTLVELVREGIRLRAFFEPPVDVPAVSPQRNLLKHRVILESIQNGEDEIERNRETADGNPHWLEHNEEPAEECRRWAEKAAVASADILAAFEALKGVNRRSPLPLKNWVGRPPGDIPIDRNEFLFPATRFAIG